MKHGIISVTLIVFTMLGPAIGLAQGVISSSAPNPAERAQTRGLLGSKLRPEILAIVKEIEAKTRQTINAQLIEMPEFQLGASFIDEESGRAIITVDAGLEMDRKKLEAVLTHELLHLRLTVNGYPAFIWSPEVRTAKGLAIDVEQSNINDLRSIIEHRVFLSEMIKFDLYRYIDLAGDTLKAAKSRRGDEAGQSDVINYVRAILEYTDPKDIAAVKQAYIANGWQSSVTDGVMIASIIERSVIASPQDIETVFLKCVAKLYPPPSSAFAFSVTLDKTNRHFRQMVLNIGRVAKKRN